MAQLLLQIDDSIYERKFAEGRASETVDGAIHIHDVDSFPIICIYSREDGYGNFLDSDKTLEEFAKLIVGFLNNKVGIEKNKKNV